MRIYRILERSEYKSFLEKHSILNPHQQNWEMKQRMLFPENTDRYGKFFYFELEDAFQFARFYDNCTTGDMILELDIDSETALKFLTVAEYYYPESPENQYGYKFNIPELFLDHKFVDKKLQGGEYRLIDPKSELKDFTQIYENKRTPGFVELGNTLSKIISLKDVLSIKTIIPLEVDGLEEFGIDAHIVSFRRAKKIKNQLNTIAEKKFLDYVREHKKYMALVPVEERQPD